jgi:hypothetical protein
MASMWMFAGPRRKEQERSECSKLIQVRHRHGGLILPTMDEAVARLNVELGAANARGKSGPSHFRKVIRRGPRACRQSGDSRFGHIRPNNFNHSSPPEQACRACRHPVGCDLRSFCGQK